MNPMTYVRDFIYAVKSLVFGVVLVTMVGTINVLLGGMEE